MSQKLPIDNFQWDDSKGWTAQKILSLDAEAETSYMFEVDIAIPEAIHNRYIDL